MITSEILVKLSYITNKFIDQIYKAILKFTVLCSAENFILKEVSMYVHKLGLTD